MRIDSLGRTVGGPATGRSAARSGAFSIGGGADAGPARQAAPLRSAPSLDALIALQAYEEDAPRERRRKAVARGRGLLDALDGLKMALVTGREDPASLRSLAAQLADQRASVGDEGLDDVLAAIELRAQVEIAKRGG